MSKLIFTHDEFNVWETCRRQYYYKYIKRLIIPDAKVDFYLGKSIHKLIDCKLKNHNIEHLLANASDDILKSWKYIENYDLLKNKLIVSEWSFMSPVLQAGAWLNGRIDAVFQDNENNITIIDWKTGQNIPDEERNFQAIVYLYSFYKAKQTLNLDFLHEQLSFKFVKISNEIETLNIEYSAKRAKEYEQILIEKINEIKNEENYFKTANKRCKYCNYNALCKK